MSSQYYIDINGHKDGPHDLVTLMRRIRAQKINADTGIYVDNAESPIPASELADTKVFFTKDESANPNEQTAPRKQLSLGALLKDGWRFTTEHSVMTVYAGGIILLCLLTGAGMVSAMGLVLGGMLTWLLYMTMHFVFLVACLRLYRGQRFSARYLNDQFFPRLTPLIGAAIIIGMMMLGGFMLFIIPAMMVALYYIFVPYFIIDRQMNLIEAMTASRLLVAKNGGRYQFKTGMFISLYMICYITVIPAPVLLPMLAAAQAKLFEDLSMG